MKALDRYVLRQFLATFLLLVLGLPLLFVVTDLTENLEKYLGRGLRGREVALGYLYQLPQFVYFAIPIAVLVGVVFTIGAMTRHLELTAAKAGGISFFRVVRPMWVAAAGAAALTFGLGELVPVTNRLRNRLVMDQEAVGQVRANVVFQTADGRVLTAQTVDANENRAVQVVLERRGRGRRPGLYATAWEGRWSAQRGWEWRRGWWRIVPEEGKPEVSVRFARAWDRRLQETPEALLAQPKKPDEMRFVEMGRYVEAVRRAGGDPKGLEVDRQQKLAIPLAALIIALFGAPLATSSRRGGAVYGIGVSLAVTLVYLLLFRVGRALGGAGTLDPTLAAWMPNVLFGVAALGLLARVRT